MLTPFFPPPTFLFSHQALVDKSGDAQEGELLTYVADFTSTVQVMTTVQLLSSHADDEQTLDEPNTMITVSQACCGWAGGEGDEGEGSEIGTGGGG